MDEVSGGTEDGGEERTLQVSSVRAPPSFNKSGRSIALLYDWTLCHHSPDLNFKEPKIVLGK